MSDRTAIVGVVTQWVSAYPGGRGRGGADGDGGIAGRGLVCESSGPLSHDASYGGR